ncbi:hypothetical protein B296_00041569 [Ensete ventricosum]|uniref:Uncharacterized protein n=1 Tax=Ensete ventricosum TaxID=4639 RepID=A0A426Y8Z8_ENSVE|nr:hypothetical protein B296_00041569 [Ensete ventricosum]
MWGLIPGKNRWVITLLTLEMKKIVSFGKKKMKSRTVNKAENGSSLFIWPLLMGILKLSNILFRTEQ